MKIWHWPMPWCRHHNSVENPSSSNLHCIFLCYDWFTKYRRTMYALISWDLKHLLISSKSKSTISKKTFNRLQFQKRNRCMNAINLFRRNFIFSILISTRTWQVIFTMVWQPHVQVEYKDTESNMSQVNNENFIIISSFSNLGWRRIY